MSDGTPEVIDSNFWEKNTSYCHWLSGSAREPILETAYFASQYQVFFGGVDITRLFCITRMPIASQTLEEKVETYFWYEHSLILMLGRRKQIIFW